MSSKRAAAEGNKEMLYEILRLLAKLEDSTPEKITASLVSKYDKSPAGKLWYMEQRGYVKWSENAYALTPKGRAKLVEREVWELSISTPKRWDGRWHLVLFDIPKDRRKRRDVFRLHLKQLGLVLYQNSIWVHPYPLEHQVRAISDFYMLSKFVSFAIAERLTGEAHLRQRFNLN